jgi:DNA-binding NtrC family response regulator
VDRPRVLVVEDRPSVLKLMATILEGAYEVTLAPDAATALSLIGSAPFEVVLTDVRMPDASGFDVLRAVQRRAPPTAVVMMTAYADVPDAVAATRLGAYDYLAKPFDADEIALVMARAVEHVRESASAGREPALPDAERRTRAEELQRVAVGFRVVVEQTRERDSRVYLLELMRRFHGNVAQAAKRAGMTRKSLWRVMKKHGIGSERHGWLGAARRNGAH